MIGSVVFFKKNKESFISLIISKLTKSEYTHVGMIVAYNELLKEAVIIESDRFVNTRLTNLRIDNNIHEIYYIKNLSSEHKYRILDNAYKELGKKYDYKQVLSLALSLIFNIKFKNFSNNYNRLICSELIDIVLFKSGIKRKNYDNLVNVTPKELLESYDFEKKGE
jgi:uncharacterized protein YycO